MKAKLIKLTSGYEHGLVAGTGRLKRDYIGLTGEILRKRCYKSDVGSHFVLMDIQFPDGALFCVEKESKAIILAIVCSLTLAFLIFLFYILITNISGLLIKLFAFSLTGQLY